MRVFEDGLETFCVGFHRAGNEAAKTLDHLERLGRQI
jgi:hypothetical protein